MANTFKCVTKAGVTSLDVIYTVASSTTTVVLGLVLGNTTTSQVTATVTLNTDTSNSSGADCRIYANEGICQLLFFEGDPCSTTYQDRKGKYQNQPEQVTLAKI